MGRPASRLVVLAVLALGSGCGRQQSPSPTVTPRPAPTAPATLIHFTDVAPVAGLVHPIICGAPDKPYLIDTNGAGAAVIDYDGDGWMDLFVVHCATAKDWRSGATPDRLYHNLGNGRFEEVAEKVGVADRRWGAGVLAFDYDNDGDSDLYVTNYGDNRLYRNDGGRFTDVAGEAGLLDPGWSMGAAAADYDRDGDLDLYVAHYFVFDMDHPPGNTAQGGTMVCKWKGADVACGPLGFPPERDRLYRNEGNGRFTDVSVSSGITSATDGFGMGVAWLDLDGDGWLDVYVVNDAGPNLAFRNLGNGKFNEVAEWSGLALGDMGVPMSGMGVALGDANGDGSEEIFVTNYSHQPNSFFVHQGGGMWEERGTLAGFGEASYRYLGWGTTFLDVDRDGDLDLFVANGHVYPQVDKVDPTTSYRQNNQLFLNDGSGSFDEWKAPAGSALARETSSRGVVRVDFDNDGDSDLLVTSMDGPPLLLRNDTETPYGWIGISLEATTGQHEAVGARIRVRSGGREQVQVHRLGSSYMSSEDPRHLFGLRDATEATVEVEWPGGRVESFGPLAAGSYHRLVEGRSKSPSAETR